MVIEFIALVAVLFISISVLFFMYGRLFNKIESMETRLIRMEGMLTNLVVETRLQNHRIEENEQNCRRD